MSNDSGKESSPIRFEVTTPILPVADLPTSLAYYTQKLGFKIDWQAHDLFASISRDKCSLFLAAGDQGNAPTWVWVGVGDAAALFEEYILNGARIVNAPMNYDWALEMQVADPDGNVIRLGSDPDECGSRDEWRDMRGDYWSVRPEGGWDKIEARAGASYFLEQATLAKQERRYPRARSCWFNAVELLRMFGTKPELARALRELGEIERTRQNAAAEIHYDEAIRMFRELNEPWPLAHALGHLGMLHHDANRNDRAELCYQEALSICRGLVDLKPLDLANTVNRLARYLEELQRDDEAAPLLAEANGLYQVAGIEAGVAGTAARLARLYHRRGEAERSRDWMVRAEAAAQAANEEVTFKFVADVRSSINA